MGRFYGLVPDDQRARWRSVGHYVYRTVGGDVTGNLLISVICGLVYGLGSSSSACRTPSRSGSSSPCSTSCRSPARPSAASSWWAPRP